MSLDNDAVDAIAKQRAAAADELSKRYECTFKGKRCTVVHAARQLSNDE